MLLDLSVASRSAAAVDSTVGGLWCIHVYAVSECFVASSNVVACMMTAHWTSVMCLSQADIITLESAVFRCCMLDMLPPNLRLLTYVQLSPAPVRGGKVDCSAASATNCSHSSAGALEVHSSHLVLMKSQTVVHAALVYSSCLCVQDDPS